MNFLFKLRSYCKIMILLFTFVWLGSPLFDFHRESSVQKVRYDGKKKNAPNSFKNYNRVGSCLRPGI